MAQEQVLKGQPALEIKLVLKDVSTRQPTSLAILPTAPPPPAAHLGAGSGSGRRSRESSKRARHAPQGTPSPQPKHREQVGPGTTGMGDHSNSDNIGRTLLTRLMQEEWIRMPMCCPFVMCSAVMHPMVHLVPHPVSYLCRTLPSCVVPCVVPMSYLALLWRTLCCTNVLPMSSLALHCFPVENCVVPCCNMSYHLFTFPTPP